MELLVIAGSPATGKSTVARAVQHELGCSYIDLGRIREMYLDPEWKRANPEEAQMAFLLSCHIAREFVAHNLQPVILDDLLPEHLQQIPGQFTDLTYSIATLYVTDRTVLQKRMDDPTRDSGFSSIEAAWEWTLEEQARKLIPNEVRLDTTSLSVEETCQKICEICM